MYSNKSSKLSAIIGLLLSVFTLHAQSECGSFEGFVDNKDGTVTDPRFGTIWKRCAEGAEFDGKSCSYPSSTKSWIQAMQAAKESRFLGKDDWRIPTAIELFGVTGHVKDCKRSYNNSTGAFGFAASKMIAHGVYEGGAPGQFWSTSRPKDLANTFVVLSFETGVLSFMGEESALLSYRLVRAGTPSPTSDGKLEKQFEFDHEYANYVTPILNQQAKRQQARSKEFQDVLNGNDPQAMYLAAGKYRRARQDVDAAVIYETIISRFPSSPWAVKANDQLESSKPVDVYVH